MKNKLASQSMVGQKMETTQNHSGQPLAFFPQTLVEALESLDTDYSNDNDFDVDNEKIYYETCQDSGSEDEF